MTLPEPPRPGSILGRIRRGGRDASAEAVIVAPVQTVWNLVSDVEQVGRWWPRAIDGLVVRDDDSGREQVVRLDWGSDEGRIRQRVVVWDPPRRYGWRVLSESAGDRPLQPLAQISVTVTIRAEGPLSRVSIAGDFLPAGARGALAVRQLARSAKRTYRIALRNLQEALAAGPPT